MTNERATSNIEHHRLAGRILGSLHLLTRGQIERMSGGALADHIAQHLRQDIEAPQPVTDELVEAVVQKRYPYLYSGKFESGLASIGRLFTPEQADESTEKKRAEKRALVRSILEAAREAGR